MNSYPGVSVWRVALTPLLCMSLFPLCVRVCPSHPSRAVHLYLSETSIEIDSSDGMISEASTPDPSSSEDEGPSSDDDDDGDDSDWAGLGWQGNRNTDVKAARKLAACLPGWHPWIKVLDPAKRGRESAVAGVGKISTSYKNGRKTERKFSIRASGEEQRLERCFWWGSGLWNWIKSTFEKV